MYTEQSLQFSGFRTFLCFVFLILSTAIPAQAALNCGDCHGVPPLDSVSGRDYSTGAFEGSHGRHGGASLNSCINCHGPGVSAYASSHSSYSTAKNSVPRIRITSRIAGYSSPNAAARYSKGTFINQTSHPVLGNCSNVNCHFETVTPTWGSANFASPTDCGKCHGAPPADGSHPSASGSGKKHGDYYTTTTTSCVRCHPDHTAEAKPFAHATSAGNRGIHLQFNTFPNTGGSYSGDVSYPKYMPSNNPSRNGTCSGLYCHSSGQATPTYRDVTWGGGALSCSGCHGSDGAFASVAGEPNYANGGVGDPNANSHQYITAGFQITNTTGCADCHSQTAHATTPNKHVDSGSLHLNGQRNVNIRSIGGKTGVYDEGTKSCSSTYCHGSNNSPPWGTATIACDACHNASNADYWAANSAHRQHWEDSALPVIGTPPGNIGTATAYRFACSSCHLNNHDANGPVSIGNYDAEVQFGYSSATRKGIAYNYGTTQGTSDHGILWTNGGGTSCSTTYCHSDGAGHNPRVTGFNWASADGTLDCSGCHGNSTYTDYRKSTPLYASDSTKGNAHQYHTSTKASPTDEMQCSHCHASVSTTSTSVTDKRLHVNKSYDVSAYVYGVFSTHFRDGDDTIDTDQVTVNYTTNGSVGSCSNVSCHPIGIDTTTGETKSRETSSVSWNSNYQCTNCHNMNMEETDTFHHGMRNYSTGYPTTSPSGDALTGANSNSRRCNMCHVDHNIFSPDLNTSSGGRAYNLRTDIATTPTTGSGFTNTDFSKNGGGICISCHTNAKNKDTSRRRADPGVTETPKITLAQYSGSAHNYGVPARFMTDGSIVYGNCSKCHNALLNETSVFMNATSAFQFGNHNSGVRRLQGSLGAGGGETAEEQICYRCHSHTTDVDPGGGPPKAVDGKDYYGFASMKTSAEDIFVANKFYRAAGTTSTTNKLFFKPISSSTTRYTQPSTNTTDATYTGGTWIGRNMTPWGTPTANGKETKTQSITVTGSSKYWRMVTFTSPKIDASTVSTIAPGTWTVNLYSRESNTSANAYIRYKVYVLNDSGTITQTIKSSTTYGTELSTTSAPGTNRMISFTVPSTITLATNDRIVVDLALRTSAGSSSYSASYYFGFGAPSALTLPNKLVFQYNDPGTSGYGHGPAGYYGVHKPSPTDETQAVLSANKHVECNDCHNVHALRYGNHSDTGSSSGSNGTNTLNATTKSWKTNQWVGYNVTITSGTVQTRTIVSNTATQLTVNSAWSATAPTTNSFMISVNGVGIAPILKGTTGVKPTYSGTANWTSFASYSSTIEARREYQICFKCHSAANSNNTTWGGTGAAAWTNLALEFNPNNKSGHPVIAPLNNYSTPAPKALLATQMKAPWTNVGNQVMTCSDCHATDSTASKGPHGSSAKWMLTGTYKNWPYTDSAYNGTSTGGTLATMSSTNFCTNCHDTTATGHNRNGTWTTNSSHTGGNAISGIACVSCHIRVPHGGKAPRLITGTVATVPARYMPDGNGGGTVYLSGITKWNGTVSKTNCTASCSTSSHPTGSTRKW